MTSTAVPARSAGSTRPAPSSAHRAWRALSPRRTPADLGYLLVGFPLAVISFTLVMSGLSGAVSLVGTIILIPLAVILAVVTLAASRGFAHAERWRLGWVGERLDPPTPAGWSFDPTPGRRNAMWRRWWAWLSDGQLWLDALHGLLVLPLATVTFSVAVTWVAGVLGGLTSWFWDRWLPDQQGGTLAELIGAPFSEAWLNALFGLFFLLTLVPVLRGCVLAHVAVGRALLGNQRLRDLEARVAVLTSTRAAAADAEAQSLRTLERDLHDGPQQRLIRLGMDLAAAQRRLHDDDAPAVALLLESSRVQAAEALEELRALSRGIAPPVLVDRGLEAALAGVAARCPVHTALVSSLAGQRLPALAERTAYFVVSEALVNVAKHSGATSATVEVAVRDAVLEVRVEDDGTGGAHVGKGHGLAGLASRVEAVDGTFDVVSPAGGPTVVTARIPVGAQPPAGPPGGDR